MKKIMTAAALLLALAACKKEKHSNPETPLKKITTIQRTSDGMNRSVLTYDGQGRLAELKFGNAYILKTVYNYSNGFAFKKYDAANEISFEAFDGVVDGTKLLSAYFRSYNNGVAGPASKVDFIYNADGYLTKISYPGYYQAFEYINGNCTKQTTHKPDGTVTETLMFEYHTDKPNKLNVTTLEETNPLSFKYNLGFLGKPNKNLVKKVSAQHENGSTGVTEFEYLFDAEGYVTAYTYKDSSNGGPVYSETYSLIY